MHSGAERRRQHFGLRALYAGSAGSGKALQQYAQNQNITLPEDYGTYSYDDFLGKTFKIVSQADCYSYDEAHGIWLDKSSDEDFMKNVVAGSMDLKIVGIVQPKAKPSSAILPAGVAYLHALTNHVIDEAASSWPTPRPTF